LKSKSYDYTDNWGPYPYTFDEKGRLIPLNMARSGEAFAPEGFRYTKHGKLIRKPREEIAP